MNTFKLITVITATVILTSCNSNRADKKNADSMSVYTDTNFSTVDTNTMDSARTKDFPDSTTNSPRMAGGKGDVE